MARVKEHLHTIDPYRERIVYYAILAMLILSIGIVAIRAIGSTLQDPSEVIYASTNDRVVDSGSIINLFDPHQEAFIREHLTMEGEKILRLLCIRRYDEPFGSLNPRWNDLAPPNLCIRSDVLAYRLQDSQVLRSLEEGEELQLRWTDISTLQVDFLLDGQAQSLLISTRPWDVLPSP